MHGVTPVVSLRGCGDSSYFPRCMEYHRRLCGNVVGACIPSLYLLVNVIVRGG